MNILSELEKIVPQINEEVLATIPFGKSFQYMYQPEGDIIEILHKQGRNLSDRKVLDVGCGQMPMFRHFQNYTGIDLFPLSEGVESVNNGNPPRFIQGDILRWETDEKFDLIIVNHVLCNFEDKRLLMTKIHSLLSDNGIVVLADVCLSELAKESEKFEVRKSFNTLKICTALSISPILESQIPELIDKLFVGEMIPYSHQIYLGPDYTRMAKQFDSQYFLNERDNFLRTLGWLFRKI